MLSFLLISHSYAPYIYTECNHCYSPFAYTCQSFAYTSYNCTECNFVHIPTAFSVAYTPYAHTECNSKSIQNMRVSAWNLYAEFQFLFRNYLIEYHIAIRLVVLHMFSQFQAVKSALFSVNDSVFYVYL